MIRFTKEGKVDRTYFIGSFSKGGSARESNELADALDVAVAALRWVAATEGPLGVRAYDALRRLGVKP